MALKIKEQDLQVLKSRIERLDTPARREMYKAGNYARANLTKDVDKRYRWDLLWTTGLKLGDGVGIKGDLDLYAYLDDSHIDSALRSIVPPLEREAQAA